jgi:hypothetical protein
MTGLSIPPYQPGEPLRASTVNALIQSVGAMSPEGTTGRGINTSAEPAKNAQIIAENLPQGIQAHSVIYYRASDKTWHREKVEGAVPCTNGGRVPVGGRLAATPLVPGQKYVLRGNLPNGTGAQWDGNQLVPAESAEIEFVVVASPLNNAYNRVLYKAVTDGGQAAPSPPAETLTCEVIEPIRAPRFYDPTITPNPMAVDPAGFFLNREIEKYENGFLAFMSMGLVKIAGKEYFPLQATYIGGEEYHSDGERYRRRMGELRHDGDGNPLYLMRRELKTAENGCTIRRGKNTSFPFKWQYVDGESFSSGTKEIGDRIYAEFIYETSREIMNPGAWQDDDAGSELSYTDYYEMKPYYDRSSIRHTEESAETQESDDFIGISPQAWRLTTNKNQAQHGYDFAYCFDLEWAESLVPGERVQCVERRVMFLVLAQNEYGEPLYEYVRDADGNLVLNNNDDPIVVVDINGKPKRQKTYKTFQYYEIIPPKEYKTATSGQPSVELYIGTNDVLTLSDDSTDSMFEIDLWITPLQTTDSYVRPEDIATPDYELVYASLRDNKASAEVVNPLAVINDLQTDRNGHLTKRLRALFYKEDHENRKYPMLFEVDVLPYGYCIEVSNVQHYYGTDQDQCAPYHLREQYTVVRAERNKGQKGKTLKLAAAQCFKHRLQIPVMVKNAQ